MKKKLIALALIAASLSLASCNNTDGSDDSSSTTSGSTTTSFVPGEYTSLKDCFTLKDGTNVQLKATVTGTDSVGLYLQDSTASFYAYFENETVNYKIGKEYIITGSITSYASNKQIGTGFKLTEVGDGSINTISVASLDDIKANQYAPIKGSVRLTGDPLSYKDGMDNSFNIEIAGSTAPVFIKKKLAKASLFSPFNSIKKYEYFTIDGMFSNAYENNIQLSFTDPSQIVVETPTTDDEKITKAKRTISYITDLDKKTIDYSLYLPTKLSDGVSLTWSSNNTSVMSNTGKVTRPSTNTTITLTCFIKSGSKSDSVTTEMVILKKDSDDLISEAQDYYRNIDFSKSNFQSLKTDLSNLISQHFVIPYNNLINVYSDSDTYIDENGNTFLIDIYSDQNYKLNETASSSSAIGQGWNKEHTVPQSWFDKQSPMVSDAFHIFPTDTFVNSERSDYVFGEVSNGKTYGNLTVGSEVVEIADEYKGDIARVYFYMATTYQSKCGSWKKVFTNSYPHINTTTLKMFLQWANNDPVSEREILRNNAIFKHQGNRNPFVDKPGLAAIIFPGY